MQAQLPLFLAVILLLLLAHKDQAAASRQTPTGEGTPVEVTTASRFGLKAVDGSQQQQLGSQTQREQRIWLQVGVAGHFPGASLQLKHYLDYYVDYLGFDPQYISLSVNFNSTKPEALQELDAIKALLAERQLPYHLWHDEFSDYTITKVEYELFTKRGVQPTDWIAITDPDELPEYPVVPVSKYVEQLEKEGANWVRGWLQDRLAVGGVLPAIKPSPPLAEQFPVRCALTHNLYGGYGGKVVLTKAYWGLQAGHHNVVAPGNAQRYFGAFDVWNQTAYSKYPACYMPIEQSVSRPDVCKDTVWKQKKGARDVTIGHYKWHQAVVQSYTRRLAHWKHIPGATYHASEAVLAHLQQNDMKINITVKQFGCHQIINYSG